LAFDKKPSAIPNTPHWQERSARIVHVLFYIVILGMVASGMGMIVLSGAGPALFGQSGILPDFWDYAPRIPHGIGARLLVALLVLHIGAALYHQYIRRDGLLSRMWFAR
ncbi:MAG: cytochrome b/b6 domain-containing protein, partial [Pseudomonadota bacterium]